MIPSSFSLQTLLLCSKGPFVAGGCTFYRILTEEGLTHNPGTHDLTVLRLLIWTFVPTTHAHESSLRLACMSLTPNHRRADTSQDPTEHTVKDYKRQTQPCPAAIGNVPPGAAVAVTAEFVAEDADADAD